MQGLVREGRTDRALARVDGLIASLPNDPLWPFQKALLLTSQKRSAEAIAAYERLTRAYPSMVEAWNNLGVLYAGSGNLEKARMAFESALQCQQATRVAYANLGHVGLRLAGTAYARALHLDGGPTTLELAQLERLPEPMTAAVEPAPATSAPLKPAPSVLASIASAPVAPVPARTLSPDADRADASAPIPAGQPPAAARAVAQKSAVPSSTSHPAPATDTAEARDVRAAIAAWATAWSRKDMDGYVAAYVPGYKGGDANSPAWQAARRVRILGKSRIAVGVSRVAIEMRADNTASASFRQSYVADQLNVSSSKTLEFLKLNGRWLIRKETAGS